MSPPSVSEYPPLVELGRTLASFTSVIKSGEPWTATCQRDYDRANLALQALAHLPAGSEAVKPRPDSFHQLLDGLQAMSEDELILFRYGNHDEIAKLLEWLAPAPPSTPPAANVQEGEDLSDHWRELALQFDCHRMDAMGMLRGVVAGVTTKEDVEAFLSRPPLSAGEIVAELHDLRSKQAPAANVQEGEPEALRRWREDQLERVRDGSFLRSKQAPTVAGHDEAEALLNDIASWSQSDALLWWQIKARDALAIINGCARAEQREAPSAVVGEDGLAKAIAFVRRRLDDYVTEHGMYDPSTGVTEFSDDGEYVGELEEIIEGIQGLRGQP